ncbi:MAG: hypothetical protein JSS17_06730 [Proteobacteria bacterium]|nr:hypothetical protein [Pseudomonadota bacterium]
MRFSFEYPSLREVRPQAIGVLHELLEKEYRTFHLDHGVRHPCGIYNVSLSQVSKRLLAVIHCANELGYPDNRYYPDGNPRVEAFLEKLDAMLDAFAEHVEDCENIIKCFFPSKKDEECKRWVRDFQKQVRDYAVRVSHLVNRIKHSHGRLRALAFHWGSNFCYGYYVEGVTATGAIGPDSTLHLAPKTQAYSLNRDLMFHLCGVFWLSAQLARIVRCISGVDGEMSRRIDGLDDLHKAIDELASLKSWTFDDEIQLPRGEIRIASAGCVHIYFGVPRGAIHLLPQHAGGFVSTRADGTSRTFAFPYMHRAGIR